jgi:hypothetical protein
VGVDEDTVEEAENSTNKGRKIIIPKGVKERKNAADLADYGSESEFDPDE